MSALRTPSQGSKDPYPRKSYGLLLARKSRMGIWLLALLLGGRIEPTVGGQVLPTDGGAPAAGSEEGLETNPFFPPATWAQLPRSVRHLWVPPSPQFVQEHRAQPRVEEIRKDFWQTLLGLVKAAWLPLEGERHLVYLQSGKDLEELAESYFYLFYEQEGQLFQIKGYWPRLVLLIKLPAWSLPEVVQQELATVRVQGTTEVQPYAEVPEEVEVFIQRLWERYLKGAPPPGEEARVAIFEKRWGGIRFITVLHEDPLQEYTVSLWTNGQVMEVRAEKPVPWDYSNAVVIPFTPNPVRPEVQPLNPQEVLYEESRLFWDAERNPVPEGPTAHQTLLRILYRRPTSLFRNMEFWVRLPVTPGKWHLCEYYALMRRSLAQIEEWIYGPSFEEGLDQPQLRGTALIRLAHGEQTFKEQAASLAAFPVPPEVETIHTRFREALDQGVAAWSLAGSYWQRFVEGHPRADRDSVYQASRNLAQHLEPTRNAAIRETCYELLQSLVELLSQQSISETG